MDVAPDLSLARHAAEGDAQWIESEGQVVNYPAFVLCLLFAWLIVPALYAAYRWFWTNAHVYTLTDQRLSESSGLFSRSVEIVELYRVKDLSIEQPLLQRMLGRGRVVIETSDRSTPTIVLNAIRRPEEVASMLRERVERTRVTKGVREID